MNYVRNSDDISEDSTSVRTDSKSATYVHIPVTNATTISIPKAIIEDDDEEYEDSGDFFYCTDDDDDEEFTFPDLAPSTIKSTDLRINDNLIKLTEADISYLFNKFPKTTKNAEILSNIYDSPYSRHKATKYLRNWWPEYQFWNALPHMKKDDNGWFFNILKHLGTRVFDQVCSKYFPNHLSNSDLNDEEDHQLYFNELRKANYTRKGRALIGKFMSDLKDAAVVIDSGRATYIIYSEEGPTFISRSEFKQKLKDIKLTDEGRKITGWDVFDTFQNSRIMTYDTMKFYSHDPAVYSIFQGYPFRKLAQVNLEIVKPFLNHMKLIICNRDAKLYYYLTNWLAFIVQHPEKKVGTALVIIGDPGTGKNTFTDTICKIFGPYANPNAKLDNFTGTFNSSIVYKRLVVCNEVRSYSGNRNYDHDALKTLITEESIDVNQKYVDVRHLENVTDFIFLSNNVAPIRIEENDRRFCILETSTEYMNNEDYFKNLYLTLTRRSFLEQLLTYFYRLEIDDDWTPHQIPETEARRRMQEYSKGHIWHFLNEHAETFEQGTQRGVAFDLYKSWCKKNNYPIGTMQEFKLGLLRYCKETRPWTGSNTNRPTLYKFKKERIREFSTEIDKQFNEG